MSKTFRYVSSAALVDGAYIILGCPDGLISRQTLEKALHQSATAQGMTISDTYMPKLCLMLKIKCMDSSIEHRIAVTHGPASLDLWAQTDCRRSS